jgi:hypothetical protein
MKTEFKELRDFHREESKHLKNQHENIIRIEDKCKKITHLITEAKNKNAT